MVLFFKSAVSVVAYPVSNWAPSDSGRRWIAISTLPIVLQLVTSSVTLKIILPLPNGIDGVNEHELSSLRCAYPPSLAIILNR